MTITHRVSGYCGHKTCDHRIHETANSDFPIWIRESTMREYVGCRFPDREIEEPWSSSGQEEGDPVRADMLRGVRLRQYTFISLTWYLPDWFNLMHD
jgi:hypothetical protein